jgi:hypothetical protein
MFSIWKLKKQYLTYYLYIVLTVVICFFPEFKSFATVYYVSNSGNDANTGVTTEQAWKTIARVNRFFFKPGDQILFKRGDTFVGTITVKYSGTNNKPITYGAWGEGAKPVISGFTTITGWTNEGDGIYSKTLTVESNPEIVTVNGVQYAMGRTPNSDRYNPHYDDYYHIDAVTGDSNITDAECNAAITNWTGAEAVIRSGNFWDWEKETIVSHSGTILDFGSTKGNNHAVGFGYFIQNDLRTLDQFGEWYYGSGKFYMYFGTANPNNYTVKVSTKDRLIYVNTYDHITIKNLKLEGANHVAVGTKSAAANAYDLTVDNCDFDFNYTSVYAHWSPNLTVTNCNILRSSNRGIYNHWYSDGAYIARNVIDSTGLVIGAFSGDISAGSGTAIMQTYAYQTLSNKIPVIEYNTIINSGYDGIFFSGNGMIVRNNYINKYCMIASDGGGIYYGNKTDFTNMIIDHNIVLNGMLNTDVLGLPKGTTNTSQYNIYLDYYSKGFNVTNNLTAHASGGIMLHGSQNVILTNNTIYDCEVGVRFQELNDLGSPSRNVKMSGNIIFSKSISQRIITARSTTNDFSQYGTFTNNYYAKPDDDTNAFATLLNTWNNTYRNFTNWKSFTKLDEGSHFIPIKHKDGEREKLFYNNTNQNITFNLGKSTFKDVKGEKFINSFILEPFTSKILIGKNFEEINRKPQISDQSFHIRSPKFKNDSLSLVSAYDPDLNQVLRYSIYKGNDTGWFSIDSISGRIYAHSDIDAFKGLTTKIEVLVKDNSVNSLSDSATIIIHIEGSDTSPPEITSFSIPKVISSYYVPVESFTVEDDTGIKGYFLSLTPETPSVNDSSWINPVPDYIYLTQQGKVIIYAWAIDFADNISNPFPDTVSVTFPEISATHSEYLFEENSGNVVFDSHNTVNGSIIKDIQRGEGVLGNGLIFNGAGYVNLGKSYGENISDQITISAWLKPELTHTDLPIITHGGFYSNTFELFINADSATIVFITNGTLNTALIAENVTQLWDGNWHHLSVTFNGNKKTIYLDGNKIAETEDTGIINSGFWNDLYIGASINSNDTSFYHGKLDEVRIYNYALNDDETVALFHSVNKLLNAITTSEYISICDGENYLGWTETGEYNRVLKRKLISASGADSIIITNLIVYPAYYTDLNTSICEGDTLTFNNQKFYNSGTYSQILKSIHGCDSIISLKLNVHSAYQTDFNTSICEGDTLTFNNQKFYNSGTYSLILKSIHGCDSIISLKLNVHNAYQTDFNTSICEGDTLTFNNQKFYNSGTYSLILKSIHGCDSIISLKLNVHNAYQTDFNTSICEGDTLTFNNQKFYNSGTYSQTLKSIHGCDSIISFTLNVYPKYLITEEISILSGTNYQGWTTDGTYQRNLISINGCDSIINTYLKVIHSFSQSINLEKGWNIFSAYLIPAQVNLRNVLEPLEQDNLLITVLDENDKTYQKEGILWVNNIGDLRETEGYKIRVNRESVIKITGLPVQLPMHINLDEGWNYISFPYQGEVDAMDVIKPLIEQGVLKKAQDERGNSIEFWGDQIGWINGIGNFNAGEGYLVEVNNGCILTIKEDYRKSGLVTQNELVSINFKKKFEGNGFGHMNINITGLTNLQLEAEDELAAFDGDKCVGVVKLSEFNMTKNVASIKASISDPEIANGFTEGNKIDLLVWRAKTNREFRPKSEVMIGSPIYQKHGSVFFRFMNSDGLESLKNPLHGLIVFPNPAKDKIHIQFQIEPDAGTFISLTDLTGKEIINKEAKLIFEDLNISSHPSGIYFVKITSAEHTITKKILKR